MLRVLLVISAIFAVCSAHECGEPTQCGLNEVIACVKDCPPERTCRNRGIIFRCRDDGKPCTKKCVCKKDYYRNAIGTCITGAECDKCQRPNEFYACDSACDNECFNINLQNRTRCPIMNIKCNEKCYCDDGYARDEKNNCIPVYKCPPACKGPNEIFTSKKTCPPELCFSLVAKIKCDPYEIEKTGCFCKPGYLRVKEGSPCVPICKCPEMASSPDCRKPRC